MSYTPNEWDSGDVVTAVKMNALETAVGEMNMSYTPNTWSDGDILTASKMNALEQAVASGGGGSSDFSTAEVTITLSGEGEVDGLTGAILDTDNNVTVSIMNQVAEEQTYVIILYKGSAEITLQNVSFGGIVTVSGNITRSYDSYIVTGDGTITIS